MSHPLAVHERGCAANLMSTSKRIPVSTAFFAMPFRLAYRLHMTELDDQAASTLEQRTLSEQNE